VFTSVTTREPPPPPTSPNKRVFIIIYDSEYDKFSRHFSRMFRLLYIIVIIIKVYVGTILFFPPISDFFFHSSICQPLLYSIFQTRRNVVFRAYRRPENDQITIFYFLPHCYDATGTTLNYSEMTIRKSPICYCPVLYKDNTLYSTVHL